MDIKGSKTEQNLMTAFNMESQARSQLSFYADAAEQEGYRQLSEHLEETSVNDKTHAKLFYELLNGSISDSKTNLQELVKNNNSDKNHAYLEFAQIASEEGFSKIAAIFEAIAKIDFDHYQKYCSLLKDFEEGGLFMKSEKHEWFCKACGYTHKSYNAPSQCPVCKSDKKDFYLKPHEISIVPQVMSIH